MSEMNILIGNSLWGRCCKVCKIKIVLGRCREPTGDTDGEAEVAVNWESSIDIYTQTRCKIRASLAQMVKNLPTLQETWVWSPTDGVVTHSSILAWRMPWTEEPGGLYSPRSHKESDTTEQLTVSLFHICRVDS